jgi:mono/diheme cytochrome c family protein
MTRSTASSRPTERKPDPAGGARALPAGSPAAATKAFVRPDLEATMRQRQRRIVAVLGMLVVSALVVAGLPTAWAQAPAPADSSEPRDPPPPLPADVLKDAKVIAQGEALWQEQCTHCHGAKAYPGKAPKLEPRRYKPDFVWDRVHNGFRNMPPWKEIYTPEQEIAIVAYVLSDDFWP